MKADIGFIGLAVMGENLVLNMERNRFSVAVYNRTTEIMHTFIHGRGKNKNIIGAKTLQELVASVSRPRKIMLMIKAGSAVDGVISDLLPLLEKGDIIIDGGNSNFEDSSRREHMLKEHGILFVGTGVSGGEEGALNGPSIMPGGSFEAWSHIKPIFTAISAKAKDNSPCCEWIGAEGSGHYVKMIHNGIEYGDMQLLAEIYWLMKHELGLEHTEMANTFKQWNTGVLDSYLVEITAEILNYRDTDERPLVESILDAAGQKGTGKWTGIQALNEGIPLTLITESVFARALSSQKEARTQAAQVFQKATSSLPPKSDQKSNNTEQQSQIDLTIQDLHDALYASKIVSYAQGFELMAQTSRTSNWNLDLASIARIWRAGCIIRSQFLDHIAQAFEEKTPVTSSQDNSSQIANLILSPYFTQALKKAESGWRKTVATAILHGIPVPTLSAALAWFDGYTSENLPANLIQAQRDYFGAHTYERKDKPRGEFYHTDWTGHGGATISGTYSV